PPSAPAIIAVHGPPTRCVLVTDRLSSGYETARSGRRRGMRRVGELAELGGEQVGGLLADVHCPVTDPLDGARDDDHAQAPLAHRRLRHHVDEPLDEAAVRAIDELVEL